MIHVDRDGDTVTLRLDLDAARLLREVMVAEWRTRRDRTAHLLAELLTGALRPTTDPHGRKARGPQKENA